MKFDSKYKIEFAGLKIGSHQFNFNADKQFFDRFKYKIFLSPTTKSFNKREKMEEVEEEEEVWSSK